MHVFQLCENTLVCGHKLWTSSHSGIWDLARKANANDCWGPLRQPWSQEMEMPLASLRWFWWHCPGLHADPELRSAWFGTLCAFKSLACSWSVRDVMLKPVYARERSWRWCFLTMPFNEMLLKKRCMGINFLGKYKVSLGQEFCFHCKLTLCICYLTTEN
jgi:hypothetical protein